MRRPPYVNGDSGWPRSSLLARSAFRPPLPDPCWMAGISLHNRKRPSGEEGRFWGYYREERSAKRLYGRRIWLSRAVGLRLSPVESGCFCVELAHDWRTRSVVSDSLRRASDSPVTRLERVDDVFQALAGRLGLTGERSVRHANAKRSHYVHRSFRFCGLDVLPLVDDRISPEVVSFVFLPLGDSGYVDAE
jgi:hypothetical protein